MNISDSTTKLLAHKIRLYKLTRSQLAYFHRACGTARWAYNKAIELSRAYVDKHGKPPTFFTMERWIRELKAADPELDWLNEVGSRARNGACEAASKAWQRYFSRLGYNQRMQEKKGKPHWGKPKFKKRGRSKLAFRAAYAGECKVELAGTKNQRSRIWIPKLGWVKGREPLRFDGTLVETRITKDSSGRWFAVILVKVSWTLPQRENQATGGLDMGVKSLAVDSDGVVYDVPKAKYNKIRKQLRRWQRKLSRRYRPELKEQGKPQSKGYYKAKEKVARLYAKMADLREVITHRVSHALVHKYTRLAIEDLNVRGMMASGGSRKRGLNRGIAEASLATLRTQLEYKGILYGCEIVAIDRWFASSQYCANCGFKKEDLTLRDRVIICESCGQTYDRDVNAAVNLKKKLGRTTPEVTTRECDTSPAAQAGDRDTRRTRNPKRTGKPAVQLSLL